MKWLLVLIIWGGGGSDAGISVTSFPMGSQALCLAAKEELQSAMADRIRYKPAVVTCIRTIE